MGHGSPSANADSLLVAGLVLGMVDESVEGDAVAVVVNNSLSGHTSTLICCKEAAGW